MGLIHDPLGSWEDKHKPIVEGTLFRFLDAGFSLLGETCIAHLVSLRSGQNLILSNSLLYPDKGIDIIDKLNLSYHSMRTRSLDLRRKIVRKKQHFTVTMLFFVVRNLTASILALRRLCRTSHPTLVLLSYSGLLLQPQSLPYLGSSVQHIQQ